MNNLGKILKHIRIFCHYTQVDLSKEINVARSYISQIESGIRTPSIEVLQKYSDCFNISLSTILLFAENYDNRKDLKGKAKKILTKTTTMYLDWICVKN